MIKLWLLVAMTVLTLRPLYAAGELPLGSPVLDRANQRPQVLQRLTPENLSLSLHPLSDTTYWKNMLWTMTLGQPSDPMAQQALAGLLDPSLNSSVNLIPALRTSAVLYSRPVNPATRQAYAFVPQAWAQILQTSRDAEVVALTLALLAQEQPMQGQLQPIKERFPLWFMQARLRTTIESIEEPESPLPPLGDLLNQPFLGLPQLYLFCRPDRAIPCLSMLKNSQGQFYRPQGQLWNMSLLARSIYPLDWNFSSGETPQGLMRIAGTMPRTPPEYRPFGQFPSIKIFLPNEKGASFIPGIPETTTLDLGMYRSLWPRTWQNYRPVEQSYWAGNLGRSLLRIHGSGEDPSFFYPNPVDLPNPTIGCIGALEQYTPDGRLIRAELPQLLNAWNAIQPGAMNGYLWLIEVPGTMQPVSLGEIEPLIAS